MGRNLTLDLRISWLARVIEERGVGDNLDLQVGTSTLRTEIETIRSQEGSHQDLNPISLIPFDGSLSKIMFGSQEIMEKTKRRLAMR